MSNSDNILLVLKAAIMEYKQLMEWDNLRSITLPLRLDEAIDLEVCNHEFTFEILKELLNFLNIDQILEESKKYLNETEYLKFKKTLVEEVQYY
jgi:hypothetical protein